MCSECGGPLPVSATKGRPFLTCGVDCAKARRNRLHSPARTVICLDCSTPIYLAAGRVGRPPERCGACALIRRAETDRATRQRWIAAHPETIKAASARQTAKRKADPAMPAKRRAWAFRKYGGLTAEQVLAMAIAQDHRCAICGNPPEGRGKADVLHVDHCHKTGKVRALLCGWCNIAIGLLGDDPAQADRAAAYLRHWSADSSAASA